MCGEVASIAKVLVVDDEEMVREVVSQFLQLHGFSHILAKNGQEGKALYACNDVWLVIADVCMPLMDGIELYHDITVSNPDIFFIIMSGYLGHAAIAEWNNNPQVVCIAKPFMPSDLINIVHRFKRMHEARQVSSN